jgi:hypothetical protein
MKLTDDEKKSVNWILQDPEREVTLDEELWEDWDGQEVKTTELQISPAWNGFCGEVKTNSICGLVFRLAITGTIPIIEPETAAEQLRMHTL